MRAAGHLSTNPPEPNDQHRLAAERLQMTLRRVLPAPTALGPIRHKSIDPARHGQSQRDRVLTDNRRIDPAQVGDQQIPLPHRGDLDAALHPRRERHHPAKLLARIENLRLANARVNGQPRNDIRILHLHDGLSDIVGVNDLRAREELRQRLSFLAHRAARRKHEHLLRYPPLLALPHRRGVFLHVEFLQRRCDSGRVIFGAIGSHSGRRSEAHRCDGRRKRSPPNKSNRSAEANTRCHRKNLR